MATSAFGKAFRAARAAGDKTFEFNGKKYTTQLASDTAQPSVGGTVKAGEYKPRRTPEDLTSTTKPGTSVNYENTETSDMMKRGGKVKSYAKGGSVTRADGCISKGHTKGRMI